MIRKNSDDKNDNNMSNNNDDRDNNMDNKQIENNKKYKNNTKEYKKKYQNSNNKDKRKNKNSSFLVGPITIRVTTMITTSATNIRVKIVMIMRLMRMILI